MAKASSITGFLDDLESEQRTRLYQSSWTCQAVFRSLPPLAKAFVLDLLLTDRPVPHAVIDARGPNAKQYDAARQAALGRLLSLDLLIPSKEANVPHLRLHPTFQAQLQSAAAHGGRLEPDIPQEVKDAAPSIEELDDWAHGQWEALQMYLLDESSTGPTLPPRVALDPLDFHKLLENAKLITGKRHNRKITDEGFQFLLRDSHTQLWVVLTRYIHDASDSKATTHWFMRVGKAYALDDLSASEQTTAGHMMQLGLLLPFEAQGMAYYCPTRLASSLCAAGTGADGLGRDTANTDIAGGHIIVESNYKVNAYTTSRVQRSLLALFCRCEVSLPNFWVGALTHESVNRALDAGISADEMIRYLEDHVHPHVMNRVPPVPENVSDQIRLWEGEAKRLKAQDAVYYGAWDNIELYDMIYGYTKRQGWLLWVNGNTRAFVAKEEGHEKIKTAIKAVKEAQAGKRPMPQLG